MNPIRAVVFTILFPCFVVANPFLQDLEIVLKNHPNLIAETEKLKAFQESKLSKQFAFTPDLTLSIGKQKDSLDYDFWKASLSWNLFRGGADYYSLSAASKLALGQQMANRAEHLKVQAKAAELIFKLLYTQDVIKRTKELVRLRTESHRIVEEKFKQGKSPLQEVQKSAVDKTQQETKLRALEVDLLTYQAQIKVILYEPLQTKSWPFDSEFKFPNLSGETLSPTIQQLELTSLAALDSYKVAKSTIWPSLDLTSSYIEYPLAERSNKQWSTGLILSYPLWRKYESSAQTAKAWADAKAAEADFLLAKRAETSQRNSWSERFQLLKQNLLDSLSNLEKSKKLYQDMLVSFRLGRMSVNELLIEQNRLIESELNVSQSQLSFHQIIIESCGLAGLSIQACIN